jgi:pyruvate-ferredoxin/flavodoxin oxidoreductase
METRWTCIDGNEAAASIAYRLSEVIAIYPITPASPMGELADAWSESRRPNLWGLVPEVVEMQSEAGAAGALHGALQKGALATTFTSSQGLLLMLPNMFKIAGELLPTVIHVAARTVATHALSIFGDHSDVMAARTTGFAMLSSASVQESHDFAAIAHLASLESRVPFLHFFDGFRTSHEVNKITMVDDVALAALTNEELVRAHRERGMTPDAPSLRGSAQNPDVFFQAREAANPYYDAVPLIVENVMERFGEQTGRGYRLVDYEGPSDADRVIVLMGSGAGAVTEAVTRLNEKGERVGVVTVKLYRPFPARALVDSLPRTVRSIAVLDRTKEPGAVGEPLFQDVMTTLAEAAASGELDAMPRVIGGRYGLSSKEFTPAMAAGVFGHLAEERPKSRFTVGIVDDVTHTNIEYDRSFSTDEAMTRAVFFGLGSDGTVGANKSSVKIVGEATHLHAQGYFVYDSKKSGSVTVSHLRFSDQPITSTYLISSANFVACHQFNLLRKLPVLDVAEEGAVFLLNSPFGPNEVWRHLPPEVQRQIIEKNLDFYVVDAQRLSAERGLGTRINTVMQACFFAVTGMIDIETAVRAIKKSIEKSYGKLGAAVVDRNFAAVDDALGALQKVVVPETVTNEIALPATASAAETPDFVRRVTARLMAGEGDLLPVSALPVDGVFPTATARFEKRVIAQEIPEWDPAICIDCGHCAIVCPHAAIRMKVYEPDALGDAPPEFKSKDFRSAEVKGKTLSIQVAPFDCTGCGICVDVCPVKSKTEAKHKALNMVPADPIRAEEQTNFDYFLGIEELDRSLMDPGSIKGSQARTPLFEFSGACAGCGETPYLKLLTQLFGDRLIIANATGCSSIYGGNLPTTPWTVDSDGRGPVWANSLFEDNAEFGFGIRLAADRQRSLARALVERLAPQLGQALVRALLDADQSTEEAITAQRARVAELGTRLHADNDSTPEAQMLLSIADELVDRSVWIIGGDGWAYDIGSAGLDHVLASGRNVNILVLDTEVYSNTGGQASKATPRGAVAKFASAGKRTAKKDIGMIAAQYGDVYVASIALGANYKQTITALIEAEAHPGPSLVIAYSTCIAHGIDMATSMTHQKDAVKSGYWPLYRYRPGSGEHEHPFVLDSKPPSIPVRDFALAEARFAMLDRTNPERSEQLLELAQDDVDERWRLYSQLAQVERTEPGDGGPKD